MPQKGDSPRYRPSMIERNVATVLNLLDEQRDDMVQVLADLVEVPSVSGTDAENEIIHHMAGLFDRHGLDVDHWQIPLDEMLARPDFPGSEVDRHEAWGAVGVLPGADASASAG